MLKNRRLFATALRDYSWLFVTIRDYSELSQTLEFCAYVKEANAWLKFVLHFRSQIDMFSPRIPDLIC